jgi:hypothetical protein
MGNDKESIISLYLNGRPSVHFHHLTILNHLFLPSFSLYLLPTKPSVDSDNLSLQPVTMQFTSTLLLLLGALCPLAAQAAEWNIDQVPKCAHDCLAKAFAETECKRPQDLTCMCLSKKFKDAATPCVRENCSLLEAYGSRPPPLWFPFCPFFFFLPRVRDEG